MTWMQKLGLEGPLGIDEPLQEGQNVERDKELARTIASELKSKGFVVRLADNQEDRFIYTVDPRLRWETYVRSLKGGEYWEEESRERGNEFEEIMLRHGLELGSVGGHPPNFDYHTLDGILIFVFNGNPYHI